MYEKVTQMMSAGQELMKEVGRLEQENATLKSKLGCS
jgi:hypothetical protein